ncbi:MAG: hypothetical protein K6A63_05410 [Acholeplasmatales bacterium]|nr:hypothetical protein [Acholeplasmatales bacterium]
MKVKKLTLIGLSLGAAALTLTACGGTGIDGYIDDANGVVPGEDWKVTDSLDVSGLTATSTDAEYYDTVMGTYEDELILANKASTASEKYYHYAKAEAYLLDQALILPTTTRGGYERITKIAPGSAPGSSWGFNEYVYGYMGIATENIKPADIKKLYKALNSEKDKASPYALYSDGTHTTTYNPKAQLEKLGYTTTSTYKRAMSTFPKTFDITNTYRASDYDTIAALTETLIRYDAAGNTIPGMAESWTVSDDGLTYTFNIRQGVKWMDAAQATNYGDVTAADYVYGMQCAYENDMTSYMLMPVAGYGGTAADLEIKATDTYTLQIKLNEKTDWFLSSLNYATFCPIKQSYKEAQGANYGSTYKNILYCGQFYISSYAADSNIIMLKNPNYFDAANMTVDRIEVTYDDGSDPTKTYENFTNGATQGVALTSAILKLAQADGSYDVYAYTPEINSSTTYFGGFNLNRQSYATSGYEDSTTSTKSASANALSKKALLNTNFRRAIMASLNKKSYNAASTGEQAALLGLRNTYVPYNYVSLTEKVGSYKSGTAYGDIVLAEMQKLGSYVVDLKDGVNGYFSKDAATAFITKAWEELGFTDDTVVEIDFPVDASDPVSLAQAQQVEASLEDNTGNKIQVNIVKCSDIYAFLYSNYYVDSASELNYDFDISSGWGPDYGEPSTYINTLGPSGDMIRLLGINQHDSTKA